MLTRSEHGIRFRDLVHCCHDQSPRSPRASLRWAQVPDNRRGVIPAAIRSGQYDEKPVVSDIFRDFRTSTGIRHRLPNVQKTLHYQPIPWPLSPQFRPDFDVAKCRRSKHNSSMVRNHGSPIRHRRQFALPFEDALDWPQNRRDESADPLQSDSGRGTWYRFSLRSSVERSIPRI